jgi:uncharacterized membrane protein YkvA (DUF1232 family)
MPFMRSAVLKNHLIQFTKRVKQELQVYRIVMVDERTPWLARVLLGAAVGYLLLPFDLIPDAIPILGQLDDLLIVPGLFWLALKLIPEEILEQARLSVQTAGNERLEGDETAF